MGNPIEINSPDDAEAFWKAFNSQNKPLSSDTKPEKERPSGKTKAERQRYHSDDTPARQYSEAEIESIKKIQRLWLRKRTSRSLTSVNVRGDHDVDISYLINNQEIKKTINRHQMNTLLKALGEKDERDDVDYSHPIFNDPDFEFIVMALATAGHIDYHQTVTLLEHHQNLKELNNLRVFPILGKDGKFTKEAQEIFLPMMATKRLPFQSLTPDEIEKLRLLIQALPPSERVFFTSNYRDVENHAKDHKYFSDSFFLLFKKYGIMMVNENNNKNCLMHVSRGVFDAYGTVFFGTDYVRPFYSLGMYSKEKMEQGFRELYVHFSALRFANTVPYENIHGAKNILDFIARLHDDYHALLMSALGKVFTNILLHMVDIVRQDTNFPWSKEIWNWIDADFIYFITNITYRKNYDPTKDSYEITRKFSEFITSSTPNLYMRHDSDANKLSNAGILIFLNLIKDDETWKKLGIDVDYFSYDLTDHYKKIKKIYPKLENNKPEIQLLKINIYFEMLANTDNKKQTKIDFTKISDYIDKHSDSFVKDTQFVKTSRQKRDFFTSGPDTQSYRIALKYKDEILTDEHLRSLISTLQDNVENKADRKAYRM